MGAMQPFLGTWERKLLALILPDQLLFSRRIRVADQRPVTKPGFPRTHLHVTYRAAFGVNDSLENCVISDVWLNVWQQLFHVLLQSLSSIYNNFLLTEIEPHLQFSFRTVIVCYLLLLIRNSIYAVFFMNHSVFILINYTVEFFCAKLSLYQYY